MILDGINCIKRKEKERKKRKKEDFLIIKYDVWIKNYGESKG